jgi:hypothetical protein
LGFKSKFPIVKYCVEWEARLLFSDGILPQKKLPMQVAETSRAFAQLSRAFAQSSREVAQPLREVAQPLREIAQPLREVAQASREIAQASREVAQASRAKTKSFCLKKKLFFLRKNLFRKPNKSRFSPYLWAFMNLIGLYVTYRTTSASQHSETGYKHGGLG